MKKISSVFSIAWRRTIWRSAVGLLALALLTSTALAAQPVTGGAVGVGRGVNKVPFVNPSNGQAVQDFAGEILVQLDRNQPGDRLGPLVRTFCVELNVVVTPSQTNPPPYKDGGPINDCHVRYLLAQYFALAAPTNNQAAATQLAIWHYTDKLDLTTVQNATLSAAAIALTNQADAYVAANGCPAVRSTPPALTISPPTATVGSGQPQTYTVQVAPADAATSVTLQIGGSATFQGGGQQITVPLTAGSAQVTVINGAAGPSTITATINYAIDPGTLFVSTRIPATQTLVLASGTSQSLSASATLQQGPGGTATSTVTSTATATSAATTTATGTAGTVTATATQATTTTTRTPGQLVTVTATTQSTTTATATGGATSTATRTPTRTPSSSCCKQSDTATATSVSGTATVGATGTSTGVTETGVASTSTITGTTGTIVSNNQGAGGATRPARLPTTGAPASPFGAISLLIAALLVGIGVLMRRRDSEHDR